MLIHKVLNTIKHIILPTKAFMGIEITDYAVKVVLLSNHNSENIKLLAYTIEPFVGPCMEEGKIVDSFSLLQSIQIAVNRIDMKYSKAHFALPSPIVMVRFLKLPDLAKKDMDKLVDFEMKHNIHLPFEQPYYDYMKLSGASEKQLKNKRSSSKSKAKLSKESQQQAAATQIDPLFGLATGTLLEESSSLSMDQTTDQLCEVVLITAPGERVEEYSQIIRNAQVELSSMEIKPLSLFRTVQQIDNNATLTNQTFLLVDLGRTASDVSIFHEGQLKITRNIYINFPYDNDSNIEVAEDDPLSFLNITGGDNDFMNACNELVHELERLVNFYRYTLDNRDHEFERVIVSGDIERLDEICSHVEGRLERKVSIISCQHVQSDVKDLKHIFPSIANAFGLALRGNSD